MADLRRFPPTQNKGSAFVKNAKTVEKFYSPPVEVASAADLEQIDERQLQMFPVEEREAIAIQKFLEMNRFHEDMKELRAHHKRQLFGD